jgi:hypothetical protein
MSVKLTLRKNHNGRLLPFVADQLIDGLVRVELIADNEKQVLRLEFDPFFVEFGETEPLPPYENRG